MFNANTKKISLDEWTMLGKYNHARPCVRKLCTYALTKVSDEKYRRDQFISWPMYVLLFIPCCVIQAVWCLWDGGLKEFEMPPRYLGGEFLWTCDYDGLLEEIFEKN